MLQLLVSNCYEYLTLQGCYNYVYLTHTGKTSSKLVSKSQATMRACIYAPCGWNASRVTSQYHVWHKAATHSWHWPGNQVGKGSKEGQGTWREMAEWGYAEVGLISWRRYTAAKKRDKWKQPISIKFAVIWTHFFTWVEWCTLDTKQFYPWTQQCLQLRLRAKSTWSGV